MAQGELPIGDGQAFEIPQAGVRDPNAVKVQEIKVFYACEMRHAAIRYLVAAEAQGPKR